MFVNDSSSSYSMSSSSTSKKLSPTTHTTRVPFKRKIRTHRIFHSIATATLRLFIWIAILAIIINCSTSHTSSPTVVRKSYSYVLDIFSPYVSPTYKERVAPIVQKFHPYTSQFNERIISPSSYFIKEKYFTYAAPQVASAHDKIKIEWEKRSTPHITRVKYKLLSIYFQHIEPVIKNVFLFISPLLEAVKTHTHSFWKEKVMPTLAHLLQCGYRLMLLIRDYLYTGVWPWMLEVKQRISVFLDINVWPKYESVYRENVEPQLLKISNRLGRFKNVPTVGLTSSSVQSVSSRTLEHSHQSHVFNLPLTSTPAKETSSMEDTDVNSQIDGLKKVHEDLNAWRAKFSSVVEKGAEDLESRVQEITTRKIDEELNGPANSLLENLSKVCQSGLQSVEKQIIDVVLELPDNADLSQMTDAHQKILASIRDAGASVKASALQILAWKSSFSDEVLSLIRDASESTLRVIDNIRDLGIQEIGMRLAWMDGVSYKDWEKYHEIKSSFDEMRSHVEDVALRHSKVALNCQKVRHVEENAMNLAERTADKLHELTNVAKWKLALRDTSNDFKLREIPDSFPHHLLGDTLEKPFDEEYGNLDSTGSSFASSLIMASATIESRDSSVADSFVVAKTTSSPHLPEITSSNTQDLWITSAEAPLKFSNPHAMTVLASVSSRIAWIASSRLSSTLNELSRSYLSATQTVKAEVSPESMAQIRSEYYEAVGKAYSTHVKFEDIARRLVHRPSETLEQFELGSDTNSHDFFLRLKSMGEEAVSSNSRNEIGRRVSIPLGEVDWDSVISKMTECVYESNTPL